MEKYKTALNLLNELINNPIDIYPNWDKLFTFIHENFKKPNYDIIEQYQPEIASLYEMMVEDNPTFISKLQAMPPEYSEVVFPIAIVRFVLLKHKGHIIASKLSTFPEYFDRYSKVIIDTIHYKHKSPN